MLEIILTTEIYNKAYRLIAIYIISKEQGRSLHSEAVLRQRSVSVET